MAFFCAIVVVMYGFLCIFVKFYGENSGYSIALSVGG